MLEVDFVTLFPQEVLAWTQHSILARAAESGAVRFRATNPRDFAYDRHRKVDDTSAGGGPGMVLAAPPFGHALEWLAPPPGTPILLLDAAAPPFTQRDAERLAGLPRFVLLCGHYEGVDERIREELATECFSVGDFVTTGGELPALAIADATVRLLPGVLGDAESHRDDSHSSGLLGFPLYTRPAIWRGLEIPEVLRSGDHAKIADARAQWQRERTRRFRPGSG